MKQPRPLRHERPSGPRPVAWFARLLRAVDASDAEREAFVRAELAALGISVTLDRSWRKAPQGGAPQ